MGDKGIKMREFKFRAWDKFKKEMREVDKIDFHSKKGIIVWFLNGEKILYPKQSTEIMQFTGLKDKKGVEIYEGDIVSHPSKALDRAEAKFTRGLFRIVAKDGRDELLYYCYDIVEVIGNIHQNKDLLK